MRILGAGDPTSRELVGAAIGAMGAQYPELIEHYGIDSNKGYGAKKHLDGIKEHGITIWHRRSFGICKNFV
jgi:ribonuclease HII